MEEITIPTKSDMICAWQFMQVLVGEFRRSSISRP